MFALLSLFSQLFATTTKTSSKFLHLSINYKKKSDKIHVELKNIAEKDLEVWTEPKMLNGFFEVSREQKKIGKLYDKDWFTILCTGIRPPMSFKLAKGTSKHWTFKVGDLKKLSSSPAHKDFTVSICDLLLKLNAGVVKSAKLNEPITYHLTEITSNEITIPKR